MSISNLKLGRRKFLITTAVGVAFLAAPRIILTASADNEIAIFTWETYHDDAWLTEWTKKTGIKVSAIRTGGVDEMFAQASSGAVRADIFNIDSGSIKRYQQPNLIAPIDATQLPEPANISPSLKYKERDSVGNALCGVPYNWGTQPLMFDEGVVASGTDTWNILWDQKYAGQVNLFDDAYITVPMVALKVGAKNPFNPTNAEFEACSQALVGLRPRVKTIARGFNEAEALYASGGATLGYCQNISTVFDLQAKGKKFNYAFPKEGTPTWIDNSVISEKGKPPAVYQFLKDNMTRQSRFITASFNDGILTQKGATKGGWIGS
jgi:spermidine/putrescine transport system substrate-binding protein